MHSFDPEITCLALQYGADPNCLDARGNSAFHFIGSMSMRHVGKFHTVSNFLFYSLS